jgi:hypothetical protein
MITGVLKKPPEGYKYAAAINHLVGERIELTEATTANIGYVHQDNWLSRDWLTDIVEEPDWQRYVGLPVWYDCHLVILHKYDPTKEHPFEVSNFMPYNNGIACSETSKIKPTPWADAWLREQERIEKSLEIEWEGK